MSRRPRGICPVCRSTLSLCWSGEIRVLRKHSVGDDTCAGAGLPAVGELTEISVVAQASEQASGRAADRAADRNQQHHRIASVA